MKFQLVQGEFTDLKGPEGGDVSALHWCQEQNGRLWCGTASGDLSYRDPESTAWISVEPPFRPMLKIESLETSSGAQKNILAVSNQGSLAISSDQGLNWNTLFPELEDETIRAVRQHPLHPGLVYAGTQSGLFVSPDSGHTWERFFGRTDQETITAIAFHPNDPLTFFIAKTNGFSASVLMTANGGFTFEVLIDGEEYFSQIHSLCFCAGTDCLWVAGSGYGWRVAQAKITETIDWEAIDHGLPVSAITCMTLTADNRVVIGSNGGGLYAYNFEKAVWKRQDIEPRRRYVRCLAAAGTGIAAGFSENGVALEKANQWIDSNENLFARNISRIQRVGKELAVVSDEQLFIRTEDEKWKALSGFQLVQDVLAHGSICYTSGLYSGIFYRPDSDQPWEDLALPVSRAVLVRTTSSGNLHVLTYVKRDRIRFYAYEADAITPEARWRDCSQDLPVSSIVQDFAVDSAENTLFITVATTRSVYCYDSFSDSWMPSQLPDKYRITCLYRSRHRSDVLYAAAGKYLLRSTDFGRSFEDEPVCEFPSRISSLTLSGLGFETIWVSTENGGIYVAHLENCWNALVAGETALPINQIAVDTSLQGVMYCGTRGISCWKLAIPSIQLRLEQADPNKDGKLYLSMHNPSKEMDVDVHFLRVLQGRKPIEYLALNHGVFCPSLTRKPDHLVLRKKTDYPEIFVGTLPAELLAHGARPAVALCVPGKFHPICDIQVAVS